MDGINKLGRKENIIKKGNREKKEIMVKMDPNEIMMCIGYATMIIIGIYINIKYPELSLESADMMDFC